MQGDRPISKTTDDALGLLECANHLAKALRADSLSDGFVIGVEGTWGSGKTSLVRLALDDLRNSEAIGAPIILEFSPWLIGDRDTLLTRLFDELARKIDTVQADAGDGTGVSVTKVRDAASGLRKFGQRVSRLEGVASLAKAAGLPFAGAAEAAFKGIARLSEESEGGESLTELKSKLDSELAAINKRIVVVIDDLDRLEPRETIEILRLVRSVADFPNIVYVLCYDPAIVADAIGSVAELKNGQAYLEKIVQLQLPVPRPEAYSLRRMFAKSLDSILGELDYGVSERLTVVVDRWGGEYLKSPRAVVRTLDSIRYAWGALATKVDASDLVWLHLVKIGNPALYTWVQDYITAVAATRTLRASVSDGAKRKSFAEFTDAIQQESRDAREELIWLRDILPATSTSTFGDDKIPLFQGGEIPSDRFRDKRIASPDHYRLYFASNMPADAPREEEIHGLLAAARDGDGEVLSYVRQILEQSEGNGRIPQMLDRLRHVWLASMTKAQARSLMIALSMFTDHPKLAGAMEVIFGRPSIWAEAEWLLKGLVDRFGRGKLPAHEMFEKGAALGWLTNLLRTETFDHGRYGDRPRPERDWMFSEAELDRIVAVMHARYATLTLDAILALPVPSNVFYAWEQSGGGAEVRSFLLRSTRKNADFVAFMHHAYNRSSGQYRTIQRESFEKFMDYDVARERITRLAKGRSTLKPQAQEILTQFVNGDKDRW